MYREGVGMFDIDADLGEIMNELDIDEAELKRYAEQLEPISVATGYGIAFVLSFLNRKLVQENNRLLKENNKLLHDILALNDIEAQAAAKRAGDVRRWKEQRDQEGEEPKE